MIHAEDEFVAAVDDAMGKMKLVVENGDGIRCLADLVAIQLQYHKVGIYFIHVTKNIFSPFLRLYQIFHQKSMNSWLQTKPCPLPINKHNLEV
jgi:hypothetical protein